MVLKSSVFLILSINLVSLNFAQSCSGLQNLFMAIKDNTNTLSNATVSGCIERKKFEGIAVKEIHVIDQRLPRLGQDYVKHLIHLDILEFKNCGIEKIVPGCFRNLPALRIVGITHNPKLTLIEGGVFDIFDTIHILRLNNNKINYITDEALSNMTLQEVDFSYNDLSRFDPGWFAYSPYIRHLYFQNNHIKEIPQRAFDAMRDLENINFDNNAINKIGRESFRKVRNLKTLRLKNNRLSTIDPTAFPRKLGIETLNLAGNFFTDISNEILEKLDVEMISIDYNPILCSCYNDLIRYFNSKNTAIIKSDKCDLHSVPYCVSTGPICKQPESESEKVRYRELITRYLEIFENLPITDKKCTGLSQYVDAIL